MEASSIFRNLDVLAKGILAIAPHQRSMEAAATLLTVLVVVEVAPVMPLLFGSDNLLLGFALALAMLYFMAVVLVRAIEIAKSNATLGRDSVESGYALQTASLIVSLSLAGIVTWRMTVFDLQNVLLLSVLCIIAYFNVATIVGLESFRSSSFDPALVKSAATHGFFWQWFGVPASVLLVPSFPQRCVAGALFLITQVLLTLTFFGPVFFAFASDNSLRDWSTALLSEPGVMPLFAVSYIVCVPLALYAAVHVRAAARHFARTPLEDLRLYDLRKPILFLRSFADDQVTLSPPAMTFLQRLCFLEPHGATLDQLATEEASFYGPFVAIGKPHEPIAPYGASRGYFADIDWKTAVRQLIQQSRAVVICVDTTAGVLWELSQIAELKAQQKTLVLIHPRLVAAVDANSSLVAHVAEALGLPRPDDTTLGRPSASIAEPLVLGVSQLAKHTQFLIAQRPTSLHYLAAIRLFFRERFDTSKPILDKRSGDNAAIPQPMIKAQIAKDDAAAREKIDEARDRRAKAEAWIATLSEEDQRKIVEALALRSNRTNKQQEGG